MARPILVVRYEGVLNQESLNAIRESLITGLEREYHVIVVTLDTPITFEILNADAKHPKETTQEELSAEAGSPPERDD